MLHVLHKEQPERAIVFVRMKHMARRLTEVFQEHGWTTVPLQGNMSQNQRERAMDAFRKGEARILVATDVAARGIDIPELSHVFNMDLPDEPESYVHRIGRTGRMGRTGRAITFVQSDEHNEWKHIQKLAGITVQPYGHFDFRVDAPRGPDMGKPAIQYKGLPSSGQQQNSPQGGFGRGRSGGGGHHAKKSPQGGGRGGGHGPRSHRGGGGGRRGSFR
jgi:ATP-dependent RNA helicase RhlE